MIVMFYAGKSIFRNGCMNLFVVLITIFIAVY